MGQEPWARLSTCLSTDVRDLSPCSALCDPRFPGRREGAESRRLPGHVSRARLWGQASLCSFLALTTEFWCFHAALKRTWASTCGQVQQDRPRSSLSGEGPWPHPRDADPRPGLHHRGGSLYDGAEEAFQGRRARSRLPPSPLPVPVASHPIPTRPCQTVLLESWGGGACGMGFRALTGNRGAARSRTLSCAGLGGRRFPSGSVPPQTPTPGAQPGSQPCRLIHLYLETFLRVPASSVLSSPPSLVSSVLSY